jgi:alkyl hydroperoxide reductase subunit F
MSEHPATPREHYDVVIIGAGPAGLTAGMYSARQGLATAVVAGSIGGQAMRAKHVENFIGWQLVSGPELIARFREHVGNFDVDCFEGNLVNAILPAEGDSGGFEVMSREGLRLSTSTVIIATGKAPARLAIAGEDELVGRGVSYCATCDAAFFVGKPVAVIGPGESAADAALELSTLGAGPISLVSQRVLEAPEKVLAKIAADPAITLYEQTKPLRIEGTERVEGLAIAPRDSAEQVLAVAGVFIEVGSIQAGDFALGLVEINERGEIVIDKAGATSTPGIYAAGDVTDVFGKQIITAAGQGARAAMAATRDLKRR